MTDFAKLNLESVIAQLRELHEAGYYGETIQKWHDGEVILVQLVQQFKPKDFDKVSESIVVIEGNLTL